MPALVEGTRYKQRVSFSKIKSDQGAIMMSKKAISTPHAPPPLGAYSQAIATQGRMIFLAGQIGLSPNSGVLAEGLEKQAKQVFANIEAIARASGGTLDDIVKLTIFLTDMNDFPHINTIMESLFSKPYPARSTIQVAALPRGAMVEIEAVLAID